MSCSNASKAVSAPLWVRHAWPISAAVLAGMAVLTVVLEVLGADLYVSGLVFRWDEGFVWRDHPLVLLCEDYGELLIAAAALLALIVGVLGFWKASLRPWRRLCVYVVLCALIGPVLVVNSALKSNWGRPRPESVEEFGGALEYRAVFEPGPAELGSSFSSGHAAAGFFWTLLYFLLREARPRLATLGMGVGLALGALLGTCRVLQGRHFLMDILWSAVLMFVVNLLLYRLMMPLGARAERP